MKKRLAELFNLFIIVFGVMIGPMTSSQNQTGIIVAKAKPVEDADGHVYRTVKIGNQIWMAENLKTTRYNDGQPIPHVTDHSAWGGLRAPAYCTYNNEETNLSVYGALYNWHAVNSGKHAPKEWHVPPDAEWTTLAAYLGGEGVAGGKMKEAGFAYWLAPHAGASNSSAFSALPGGGRDDEGEFSGLTDFANFWSSTESSPSNAWRRHLVYDDRNARRDNFGKMMGFSVRCIKDSSSPESSTSVGIRK
jgi:uncharacterized protein (TIGR02145 family)